MTNERQSDKYSTVTLDHNEVREALRQAALMKLGRISGSVVNMTMERMSHYEVDEYVKCHVEIAIGAAPLPECGRITAGMVIRWAGETLQADRRTDSELALAQAIANVANGAVSTTQPRVEAHFRDHARLADCIEEDGIERIVYGIDMTNMKKLNRQLVDALRAVALSATQPICGNCDTPVPPGCGGLFKKNGKSCLLNLTSTTATVK